jgi:hypothetical protein
MIHRGNKSRTSIPGYAKVERNKQSTVAVAQHRRVGVEWASHHEDGAVLRVQTDFSFQFTVQRELTKSLEAVPL